MSPNEGAPHVNPGEKNLFVLALREQMSKGSTLDQAIQIFRQQIEDSRSYDPDYQKHIKFLEEAIEYLKT